MSKYHLSDSIERLRTKLLDVYSLATLDQWIAKHTYLDGKPYSYKDHEYQIPILRDEAKTSIIVKCAQVGLSELAYRWAVAACCIVDDMTVIYTFPTSTDAENNNRTRINPMIEGSPYVKNLVNPDMNNSQIKQFGRNSFLFFKGTKSETASISTPANAVLNDEFDKSDQENVTVYVSRLQHKPHKLRKIFSTPTIDKFGISKEAETARRYKHLAKCVHCNHMFLPDYYNHVVIPKYDGSLEEITKATLAKIRWEEAYLACPKCGQDPQLHHTRMQFVCENSIENHPANAWYVSPFSAHNIISVPYLVKSSTEYKKVSEFKNQALGLTAEEENESITISDLVECDHDLRSSEFHVMGCDQGTMCHITIGRLTDAGELLVIHKESVHYMSFERRSAELAQEYRVILTVSDSQPNTELVTRLSRSRTNFWGAIFVTTKTPLAFTLQEYEEDESEARMALNLAKVNRTVALDELLALIKSKLLIVQRQDNHEEFVQQMTSTKRVQKFTKDGELTYVWEKTDGNDHYHMSLMYMHIAAQMRGIVRTTGAIAAGIPLVKVFKLKR